MSEGTFASLGATLLARKGGAKPAMRPQWGELPETVADEQLEDLGWNDMGADEEAGKDVVADIAAIEQTATSAPKAKRKPQGKSADVVSINGTGKHQAANEDCEAVEPLIKSKPAKKKSASKARKAEKKSVQTTSPISTNTATSNSPRRAAFTLRLDADRHLKLRLAATMQGVSAQALVTEALDSMLSEIDDLDALATSMTTRMKRH